MDNAKKVRSASKGWLTRAINDLHVVIDKAESDKFEYQDALEELNKRLDNLEQAQAQVESLTELDDLEQEIASVANIFSEARILRTIANRKLSKFQDESESDHQSSSSAKGYISNIKLPKLELPKFHGNVSEWPSWWDQFQATIDTSNLPTVTKMTYLQGLLVGDAKACIEGLTLSETHYEIAKEMLEDRFGRRELIIFHHIVL